MSTLIVESEKLKMNKYIIQAHDVNDKIIEAENYIDALKIAIRQYYYDSSEQELEIACKCISNCDTLKEAIVIFEKFSEDVVILFGELNIMYELK